MTKSNTLVVTQVVDDYFVHEKIDFDVRRQLCSEIVYNTMDAEEITIKFYPFENGPGFTRRYFATAQIGRVAELEKEVETLKARIRALEWSNFSV